MAYGTTLQRLAYYYLPALFKDVMTTIFGMRRRRQRYGPAFRESLDFLRRSERWTNGQLLGYQAEQTDSFVRRAMKNSPYYRSREEYAAWKPGGDLRVLPVLTKDAVRIHMDDLYADGHLSMHAHWLQTSGTTGKGLRFPISARCYQREYAFRAMHYSWSGVSLQDRDRIAIAAGHPVAYPQRQRSPFWSHDWANNWVFFSSYHLTGRNLPAYVRELERFSPKLLGGYPSSVYLLALAYREHGRGTLRLKGIFTGSETLMPHQRSTIEEAFGVKVFNWYGNAEMCANIVECEKGELHLKLEHSHVEVLDDSGAPSPPGETGRLVCTGFGNDAFPLIRYDVGDRVKLARDQSSRCGRGGVILESIEGRMEDYIFTPDGRMVGRLDHLFKDGHRVIEAQLYQESVAELLIKIVRAPGYSKADEEAILEEARRRLGPAIAIRFEYCDTIWRSDTGKMRFIVSSVDQREAIRDAIDTGIY
jgi:phenylacetate-CoA ligase